MLEIKGCLLVVLSETILKASIHLKQVKVLNKKMANSTPLFLGFLFCFISSVATYSSNETDLLALLAFKSAILPDNIGSLNSWNQTSNFCTWEGIVCSTQYHDRVAEINLASRGLEGTLSTYIGNLSFLRRISLRNNKFQGVIPQEIGLLGQLEFVDFSGNSFSGELPRNLSKCINLVNLSMTENSFSGMIPPEFGSLYRLEVMNLTNNKFLGTIPPAIGNLTSLTHLSLSSCGLTGQIPESFGQLQSLILLQLTGNGFSGSIPLGLFNISTIQLFEVADNQLEGTIPENIGFTLSNVRGILLAQNKLSGTFPDSLLNSTTLERIGLFSNKLTGRVPTDLGRLSGLWVIALWNNFFEGDISFISSLTNCTRLSVLRINNNLFTGFLPSSIANLSRVIAQIDISHNKIQGNISSDIRNLQDLAWLDLSSNYLEGSIPLGIGNLDKLIYLDLGRNRFTGEIPSSFGNLTLLSHMFLQENRLFGSIPSSLIDCTNLLSLNISHNNLNGSIPQEIMSISSLSVLLDLSHNSLTGSIPFEVGSLRKLTDFDLSDNRLSGTIPASLGSCLSLQGLYLEGNSFEGKIPSELSGLEGLRFLDLSRNNLSGAIPSFLSDLRLEKLNLSFNKLYGQVPISGVFRNNTLVSLNGNKELCGGILELQLPPCPPLNSSKKNKLLQPKFLIPLLVFGIIVLSLSICWIILIFRRKDSFSSSPSFLEHDQVMRFSYSDLLKATGGFDKYNLVGVGRFGSVYKGIIDDSTPLIAVKVFNLSVKGASKSLLSECEVLRNVRHRNLLKLLSICDSLDSQGYPFKALIYDFKANGSLEKWLHDHKEEDGDEELKKLNMIQLLEIAIDVAHALETISIT
ncbi:receptor-like protein kinase [Dorcoceras hygrometricum]|uniref:non-specific serine/threonine protein kinase n=1 Tax=Dorcoceras hygrometricum TaxID=472368 RepID=A0A2Z7AK42_9LAMI|nr:receptor-like protein kinase [Dorcoceras hygrometricum]